MSKKKSLKKEKQSSTNENELNSIFKVGTRIKFINNDNIIENDSLSDIRKVPKIPTIKIVRPDEIEVQPKNDEKIVGLYNPDDKINDSLPDTGRIPDIPPFPRPPFPSDIKG